MNEIDFGRYTDDYVQYRPGFPESFYERVERIIPFSGVDALDLGTGPGVVALHLAKRGAMVTGLDVSSAQIENAKRQAATMELRDRCTFQVGRAEDTHLPDRSFDLITACQCWTWFDHDKALAEVRRLLRPGGTFLVAFYDYLTNYSPMVKVTEDLILQFNPAWSMAGHTGVRGHHIDLFGLAPGFSFTEQFCYDHDEPFTYEGWLGRMRTCNGVGSGILNDRQVAEFNAQLAALLKRKYPEQPMIVPHRVWAVAVQRNNDT